MTSDWIISDSSIIKIYHDPNDIYKDVKIYDQVTCCLSGCRLVKVADHEAVLMGSSQWANTMNVNTIDSTFNIFSGRERYEHISEHCLSVNKIFFSVIKCVWLFQQIKEHWKELIFFLQELIQIWQALPIFVNSFFYYKIFIKYKKYNKYKYSFNIKKYNNIIVWEENRFELHPEE